MPPAADAGGAFTRIISFGEKIMAVADMIPSLDDKALANLRENAARLETTGTDKQQKQAAQLLPLIDAELASRKAAKPKRTRASAATSNAAAASSATAATSAD